MAGVMERGAKREAGWEHHQVDIEVDAGGEGPAPIYTFAGLPLRLHGVLEEGRLVDVMLSGTGGTVKATPLTVPHLARHSSELEDPLLARSWQVPELGLSLHVEIWVDREGRGFADLFVRRTISL